MRQTSTLRTHSYAELAALNRSVSCNTCGAPAGCPCADLRSWDKDLYGVRVHKVRRREALRRRE